MKLGIIFHERHAFAFHCVRDDHRRLLFHRGSLGKGFLDRRDIVPVHFDHVPVEAGPLFRERAFIHDVSDEAIQLDAVAVDDRDDIIHPMKAAEHSSFPDLPS